MTPHDTRKCGGIGCVLLTALVTLAVAPGVVAQTVPAAPTSQPNPPGRAETLITGSDHALWVARISGNGSRLFVQPAGGKFDLGRATHHKVRRLVCVDDDALAFYRDGSIERFPHESEIPIPERILPAGAIPFAAIGAMDEVYALVPGAVGRALAAKTPANAPATPPEALAVVRYDLRSWSFVGDAPAQLTPFTPDLHIGYSQKRVHLVWRDADDRIRWTYMEKPHGWTKPSGLGDEPVGRLWVVRAGQILTLIATRRDAPHEVLVWRLLGDLREDGPAAWHPGTLEMDAPIGPGRTIVATAGFNQHIALLTSDAGAHPTIVFGRIDAPPTLETIDVLDVAAEPTEVQVKQGLISALTFAVLLAVLIGLFVFRRESMLQSATLPPGFVLATFTQRLLGWIVDFAPFVLLASAVVGIDVFGGLEMLMTWGFSPDTSEVVGDPKLLAWWSVACGGYVFYTSVIELLIGRTVGKMLTRTYVLSERGQRPTRAQFLVRNVLRLVELMPQFWVFGLLVVLSRNQQRLGDIFARTVVMRRFAIMITMRDPHAQARDKHADAGKSDDQEQATTPDQPEDPASGSATHGDDDDETR